MKAYLALCISVVVLAACGSDPKKTGAFALGGVSGLHYKTKSQSGLTDSAGTFGYKDGEDVTFSLGGVTFGTVAAADSVTPFGLFDATPPTDALALQAQLDESSRVYDYERALNVAAFLMALDADAVPSNGIDLSGRDAQLEDVSIAFDVKATSFFDGDPQPIAARVPNYAHHAYPLDAVIAYTYASLGVAASGQGITTVGLDQDGDGTPDGTYNLTLNDRGIIEHGSIVQGTTTFATGDFAYDAGGRSTTLALTINPSGSSAGGTLTTTNTYNGAGQLVSTSGDAGSAIVYDYDAFGRLTRVTSTSMTSFEQSTYNYDTAAHTLAVLSEYGTSAGALTSRYRNQYVFDASGHTTKQVDDTDATADGTYEDTGTTTYTFAKSGQVSSSEFTRVAAGATTYHSAYTYTFDGARPLSQTTASDTNGDGAVDATYVITYTYDDASRLTQTRDTRQGPDGVVHTTQTTDYVYDANGHLLLSDQKDLDDAGALTYEYKASSTYDSNGQLVSSFDVINGTSANRQSYTYGPVANVITASFQGGKLFGELF